RARFYIERDVLEDRQRLIAALHDFGQALGTNERLHGFAEDSGARARRASISPKRDVFSRGRNRNDRGGSRPRGLYVTGPANIRAAHARIVQSRSIRRSCRTLFSAYFYRSWR